MCRRVSWPAVRVRGADPEGCVAVDDKAEYWQLINDLKSRAPGLIPEPRTVVLTEAARDRRLRVQAEKLERAMALVDAGLTRSVAYREAGVGRESLRKALRRRAAQNTHRAPKEPPAAR
jgi:hypothetical protein